MTSSSSADTPSAPYTPSTDHSSSARSFPDQHPQQHAPRGAYSDGGPQQRFYATPNAMAQPTSPSMPSEDAASREAPASSQSQHQQATAAPAHHSNPVPIDPSIAQSSPTYPPQHYPGYPPPHHDMAGHYAQGPPMYRPDYSSPYNAPPHMPYGHVSGAVRPQNRGSTASRFANILPKGGHPLSTVYSFVPIPGTHQQKRPRRRYEEIERMYKCGWNGCEKAYGTLNHLNAHVTMQGHGTKRTPEGTSFSRLACLASLEPLAGATLS